MNDPRELDEAEIDVLFRLAMEQRPEAAEDLSLAHRVIAMANRRASVRVPARANVRHRIHWMASFLAMMAIAIIAVVGLNQLSVIGAFSGVREAFLSMWTSSSSSDDVGPILVVGCIALVATLTWLAVRASIESNDDMPYPWDREGQTFGRQS